jgi:hypothetical protein
MSEDARVAHLRRRLGVERATLAEVGAELGLSRDAVWRLAVKHRVARPSRIEALKRADARPDVKARKRAHLDRLHADADYRVRRDAILDAARRRRNADPAFRAKLSRLMRERMRDAAYRQRALDNLDALRRDPAAQLRRWAGLNGLKADIPLWVPRDLVPDFIDLALAFGEEEAASRVRRLKHDAEPRRVALQQLP